MIAGLAITVICTGLIIPIIFKINSANSVVLSIFGFIPPEDISELIC